MSIAGQYNIKGINSQSWAAMSLFLQHLRDPKFSYIHLEEVRFGDFYLVFNDGHKIICEAKDRKGNFNYADLKRIVKLILRKKILNENDEILIICTNLNKALKDKVEHVKYFEKMVTPDFSKKGFKKEEISVLSKVKFWKIEKIINEKIVYSLFSELMNFWIPDNDTKRIVHDLLVKKIYEGSAKGQIYKRQDILDEIDNLRNDVIKNSGYFDKERVSVEKQLDKIVEAINNNEAPEWASNQLSSISAQPNLIYFILNKFKNKKVDNIKDWQDLWRLNKVYWFSYDLFKIFAANCHTDINKKYILEFIKRHISEIRRYFRDDFFDLEIVNLINKILDQDKIYLNEAFNIIKKLLSKYENGYFFLKKDRDLDYQKEQVCKLLNRVYNDADAQLKQEIYSQIIDYFNLVEDAGEHSHYTPRDIFGILHKHLTAEGKDFEKRFSMLSKSLADQYNKFYKRFGKKVKFEGWELVGGATAWWGHNYKIDDKHFVAFILSPALSKYYSQEPSKGWNFIRSKCITETQKVSDKRPDFLNRASLGVILERYRQTDLKISSEAFQILKELILAHKGIPHKSELIYQALRGDFSDEKKLALAKISIEKYKIPVNPFVEQIISELASKQNKEAKKILADWSKNPDYYEKTGFVGNNIVQNIQKIIETSFDDALDMVRNYIRGKYFISKLDSFDVYKVSGLLNTILKKNFQKGLEIIKELTQKQNLTKNEQILLCHSILGSGEKKSEEFEFLIKIYDEFVNPFLSSMNNDVTEIRKKIPHSNAREVFVQLAERLIDAKKIEYTFRIIEVFINDPDPYLPGHDPEDPEAKYSYHKKIMEEGTEEHAISSVRGWCAWTLAQCIILGGRNHISRIIDLTEQLVKDNDYYIKHMACFPLSQLVRFRLSHMPDVKEVLFFNDDMKIALEMAKRVEGVAFDLLDLVCKYPANVKKALGKSALLVFGRMRALNEKDALRLLEKMKQFPDESTSEIAWLVIYFAELRKNDFKNWTLSMPGLYDDLHPFDDTRFKAILKEIMLKNATSRAAFLWEFFKGTDGALRKVKHSLDYEEVFSMSLKYIKELTSEYNHRTFENAYRFIEENIGQVGKFDICYEIWKDCLRIEKPALEKLLKEGKAWEINWWPYYYNGKILLMAKEKKGDKEFLDSLEYLTQYPKELNIGNTSEVVKLMKKFPYPNDQIERIFNNLIERNSGFYNDKQEWTGKGKIPKTNQIR